MKLSKALSEKKAAQNALSRLIVERNRNLFHPKASEPELLFGDIEEQIAEKIRIVDDLKLRILYTNCHTRLDNGLLLQEAIIRLGNLRSELNAYNALLEKEVDDQLVYYRGKSQIKEYVRQVNKAHLMERIEEMEAKKYELDALIAKANNNTDIAEHIPE